MTVQIAYGKGRLAVELPDTLDIDVIEPAFIPGLQDSGAAVREALRCPIGSPPLRDLVSKGDRVGIVVSDITRATPYGIMLPEIFGELSGISQHEITLFVATGTHRPNTDSELEEMLGPGIVGSYRIVQNDCTDRSSHRLAGTTSGGNDIWLLGEFLDCDVRILTGFIEPHFFAGFSGGGKAVMPGLALLETVMKNHSAAHMDDPRSRWGITIGNPLWEEVREAAGFADPSFLLNVSLNREKEITAVFAGDYVGAHAAGCSVVRERAMVPVEDRYDIVITGNSGYPLDLNMYQSVKGMSAAGQIVREGGDIIIAADCWDGIPEHGEYGRLLASASTPSELLASILAPGFSSQDMWQAQIHASICAKTRVHFHSGNLTDRQIEASFMRPCVDIGERVAEIASTLSASRPAGSAPVRVCVLPEGPQTIPYIIEKEGT